MQQSSLIAFLKWMLPGLIIGVGLSAQSVDTSRAKFILSLPPTTEVYRFPTQISPGSSSGTPTAYGAEFGDVFFGVGYQARTRYTRLADGDVYAGFGLGNSRNYVGLEFDYTSFTTIRHGFFHDGAFSFKIHRDLTRNLAIAYGWEDAIHSSGTDGGSSQYAVVTTYLPLRDDGGYFLSGLTMSGGVGNGRFQSEKDFYAGKNGVNAFGSLGLRLFKPVSFLADWTGQDLMLGASIVPIPRLPLFITPAYADVTGRAGDGARFVVGAGIDYRFRQ
ncbi:MAG TPA: hypothetical protein VJ865_16595 [Gemmatimonadaceae bacterium]|nr:hypothetical protein [Gemmatimonadaceae bacterium]